MKKFIIPFLTLAFVSYLIISCEKDTPEKDPDKDYLEYNNGKGEIGSGGGTISVDDPESEIYGASIDIPEGATSNTTEISINTSTEETSFLSDTNLAVQLLPEGTTFETPVTITLPYPNGITKGSELSVWYIDQQDSISRQYEIKTYDDNSRQLTFETNHFSTYFVTAGQLEFMIEMGKWNNKIATKVYLLNKFEELPLTYDLYNSYMRGNASGTRYYYCFWRIELMEKKVGAGYADKVLATKEYQSTLRSNPVSNTVMFCNTAWGSIPCRDVITSFEFSEIGSAALFLKGQGLVVTFDDFVPSDAGADVYVKVTWKMESAPEGRTFDFRSVEFETNKERRSAVPLSQLQEIKGDDNDNRIMDIYEIKPDFDASPLSGTAPMTVEFENKSTGWIDTYHWSFGDGTTSNKENPTHTYTKNGTYTVELVLNDNFFGYKASKKDYITVEAPGSAPIASFTASPTNSTAGETVQFTDLSVNNPTSWSWSFGDGSGSSSQNPSHTYSTPGTYTVSLTATNIHGEDTETKTNYITVEAAGTEPVAAFTANNTTITEGQSVQFTDQSTNNPTSWQWDFGDGGSSTAQNPSHTYGTPGTYTVSLTATNIHGEDTETKTNYITVEAAGTEPVAAFTANNTTITEGQSVQFTDQSTNNPTSWQWDFGDGGSSTAQNPSHTYGTPGTYTVSLTATNIHGEDTETKTNYITVEAAGTEPVAAFTANKTTITQGQSVQFNDQSTSNPTSWQWDFGDGGTSTAQNPSHTYGTPGTYTVSLTATNIHGEDTETKTNYITVNEQTSSEPDLVVNELTMSPLNPVAGQEITFTATVKNIGQAASGACNLSIQVGGESDPSIYDVPALAANETYSATRTESLIVNSYRTTARIDINQEVVESNEDNNEKYIEFTVTEGTTQPGNIGFNPDLTYGEVTDIDGNTYKTIQIGEQVWMAQNLATTQYNDGTPIPLETDNTTWAGLTSPAYCWYNNDAASYKNTYGALYNWYVVETGKLCPTGWHVPSDEEWKQLEMYLGMSQSEADNTGWRGTTEGGKLKETGTTHWNSPNTGATNASGFTAVPGGCRDYYNGRFYYVGHYGYWWSATEHSTSNAWYRYMYYNYSNVGRYYFNKRYGFSVRCLRD